MHYHANACDTPLVHGGHRHRCHQYCHHCIRDYHPNWTKGAVYGALLIADTDAKDENDGGDNDDDCDNDNGKDDDIDDDNDGDNVNDNDNDDDS